MDYTKKYIKYKKKYFDLKQELEGGSKNEALAVVKKDGKALADLSEELRADKEIVLAAVQQNGYALKFASEKLRGDKEVVLAAVQQNGYVLEYASEELRGDKEVVLAAIRRYGCALKYATEELRGDREVVLAAVNKDVDAFKYASKELKNNKEVVLAAVKQNGFALQLASNELKNNLEVVLAAVKNDGHVLQYASDELRADREVVLTAVQEYGYALYYASKELKDNREVVLAAVQQNGYVLIYASKELQNDKLFLIECYKLNNKTYMDNKFIKKFHDLENGRFDDIFIEDNVEILHLVENKIKLCEYLVNNKKYTIIYDNKLIAEYIKTEHKVIVLSINDTKPKPIDYTIKLFYIKTLTTIKDVIGWCKKPETNPLSDTVMSAMSNEYYNIYKKAYKIMKSNGHFTEDYIINLFPKNHLLFGDVDLVYYKCVKNINFSDYKRLYQGKENKLVICELLTEALENAEKKNTVQETEIEICKLLLYEEYINNYIKNIINSFLVQDDYISTYNYPERIEKIKKINLQGYFFINFLENNKMATGETVIEYFSNTQNLILEAYDKYKAVIKDIDDCFNPTSGIIVNVEDKKNTPISDPLDKYFQVCEKKLAELKKPQYSKLIDLTTFKRNENINYLNNEQWITFKKVKDIYQTQYKNYTDSLTLYENKQQDILPEPPEKPKISLPWGGEHIIGTQIDPIHIKDEVIVQFQKEYEKAEPIIEQYNKIKKMSYEELKKHFGESPSGSETQLIGENDLFSMTRDDFAKKVLNDNSNLVDKCSEKIDILTNEEFDDENYPLSKLQLMVRLKVYIPGTDKYRIECIYAPKLYNYLVECINNKNPFINPMTKVKYTQENINELMKVMRKIDNKIEVPEFIIHRNDTKLKIESKIITVNINNYGTDQSYGETRVLDFNMVYIYRIIGGVKYKVHEICTIPANIETNGDFATNALNLTSYNMLFSIFKLFNEGRLLHNYLPPYRNKYGYIKPEIHFNRIKTVNHWLKQSESNNKLLTKEELINRFKHYAQEINNFIF